MSNIKISEFIEASSVNEDDYVPIIQNGINKKVKASEIGTGGGGGDTLPIGTIIQWDFDTLPNNWLWTDHEYLIADYPQLYAICGTKYNTSSTPQGYFRTPNRAGLIAIGAGTHTDTNGDSKTFVLGREYGEYEHTLTVNELAEHNHHIPVKNNNETGLYETKATNANGVTGDSVTENAGGNQGHNNIQPSIATNFIIKARQSAGVSASVIQEDGTPNEEDVYSSEAIQNILNNQIILNNNNKYIKFDNGLMIISQKIAISKAITTSWNNNYISTMIGFDDFSTPFTQLLSCVITLEASNGQNAWIMTNGANSNTKVGNIYLISPESIAEFTGYINIIAIGMWK